MSKPEEKHNLKTLLDVLNRYLNPDPATGLIPMTPMHIEIDKMKTQLRSMDFEKWFKDNSPTILMQLGLHSHAGLTPREVLEYFVENEIIGSRVSP